MQAVSLFGGLRYLHIAWHVQAEAAGCNATCGLGSACPGHLKKVRKGVSVIVRGLGDGLPHPLQVLLPGGLQLLQRSLGHVSEDEQQDSSPPIWSWSEELQVDLQSSR